MTSPSTAVNNLCVVKKCCAICDSGEYQDNMVLCASGGVDGELVHHEFDDVCNKFVVDPLLECAPEERIAHLVSYIKDSFPNGCDDVQHCYDCTLYTAMDNELSPERYVCDMLSALEGRLR